MRTSTRGRVRRTRSRTIAHVSGGIGTGLGLSTSREEIADLAQSTTLKENTSECGSLNGGLSGLKLLGVTADLDEYVSLVACFCVGEWDVLG